jgi:hypothetical protein
VVVDRSVFAALLWAEPAAKLARERIRHKSLHAPVLLSHELTNVARNKCRAGVPLAAVREGLTAFAEQDIVGRIGSRPLQDAAGWAEAPLMHTTGQASGQRWTWVGSCRNWLRSRGWGRAGQRSLVSPDAGICSLRTVTEGRQGMIRADISGIQRQERWFGSTIRPRLTSGPHKGR